jgi:hypothetical protein
VVGRSIGVGVKNVGPKPCQLRTGAEISVLRDGGSRPDAAILGNPASIVFDWRLDPGAHVAGISDWKNWCGAREDLTLRVRVDLGRWHDETRTKPPRCDQRTKPSVML